MDKQPTTEKSKVMEMKDDGPSSVQPGGVPRGEVGVEVDVENLDKNYFTPALMDIWPKILDYVTKSEDFVSVMNASQDFRSLLEKRKASALLPVVLPILVEQTRCWLFPRDVFNCRLVNKEMKASVDRIIAKELVNDEIRTRWSRRESWMLRDRDVLQEFMDGTQGLTGNPFLGRFCVTNLVDWDEEWLINVLEMFLRFGHELRLVAIDLFMTSSPRNAMRLLKLALHYLPNLESLVLCLLTNDVEQWDNYTAEYSPFPSLEALRTLELDSLCSDFVAPPGSIVRPILEAYGHQLTRFMCDSLIFRGEPCTWRSIHFRNLLKLEVSFMNTEGLVGADELSHTYRNMAKLRCPKLESLWLYGMEMRITAETFAALNQFRGTLKELRMESLDGDLQLFQVNPSNVQEFPHLTRLTLCTVDVESEWMHLFRAMFPKLEELRFRPPPLGFRITAEPSVPDENIRERCFTLFPKLKQLIWKYHAEEDWPVRAREQIVFTRQG